MKVTTAYPFLCERFADVKEEQNGTYCSATCPLKCHSSAKLRFWLGDDGRLMFGCFRDCNKLDILRAVGLGWKDTFPGGVQPDRVQQEITARYQYRDECGRVLYETLRYEPGRNGRDKEFRQRRPLKDKPVKREDWAWNLDGVRRVLYRLPELIAAGRATPDRPVFVVAGEKDADSLAALDLIATTNVCGERSEWIESYSETLSGRNVVVIEDRDTNGRRHTNEVIGSLTDYARSVRRVRLPRKDATEYLNALRVEGVTENHELRAEFLADLCAVKCWVGIDS